MTYSNMWPRGGWVRSHLNWTLVLFGWLLPSFLLIVWILTLPSSATSADLEIYLDANCTTPWDSTNIPDMNELSWSAPDEYGWESSSFSVYVKNIGERTIEVEAKSYEDLTRVPLTGFGASSAVAMLNPGETKFLVIKVSQSLRVSSIASSEPEVYFHFSEVQDDAVHPVFWVLYATFTIWFLYLLVWNVRHKGRRLWNLLYLLIPSIGFIVFLCVNNRDQLSTPEWKAESPISEQSRPDYIS